LFKKGRLYSRSSSKNVLLSLSVIEAHGEFIYILAKTLDLDSRYCFLFCETSEKEEWALATTGRDREAALPSFLAKLVASLFATSVFPVELRFLECMYGQ
jgi:hypothetical protein